MRRIPFNSESGVILPIVIILMVALTITGIAFLSASVLENQLVMREVYKNQAFYLADAGIDHLLVKLKAGEDKPQIPPWTNLGEGDYMVVGSYDATPPYAISTGRIIKGEQEILRKIKVVIDKRSIFAYGVFGDEKVLMKGTPEVSSYYYNDPSWPTDEAQVGTNSSDPAAIELKGGAFISGDASSGVGSDPDVAISADPGAITGDRAALPEHIDLPLVDVPEFSPEMGPLSVTGGAIDDISADAKYSAVTIQGELTITSSGDLVFDSLVIEGSGKIIIPGDVSVRIFVIGDPCRLGGNAVENMSENPAQFGLYGAGDCTEIDLAGTTDFYGTVYAPGADVKVTGTGDVHGALVGKTVELPGTARIYCDASLADDPGSPQIISFKQWEEV